MDIYPQIYYVYFYLRSKDSETAKAGTPYYVGKGKGYRAWTNHTNVKTPDEGSKILIFESNLTELQAYMIERYFINWFGRKLNGTGILHNKTKGGEGFSGGPTKGVPKTQEHKDKISKAQKGKPKKKEQIEKISKSLTGFKHTEEFCKKRSLIMMGNQNTPKGHKFSKDRNQKISKSLKGRKHSKEHIENRFKNRKAPDQTGANNPMAKTFLITSPEGIQYTIKGNLEAFMEEHGISRYILFNQKRGWLIKRPE